uniref:TMEM131_like domain-containing protein n=1 Tax=Schistosoma mansoni TaxID=6183 RepID=A0A5K4F258_SCHMA
MGLYNTAGKTNHFILSLAFFSIYLLPFGSCYNGFNANNKEVQILVDGIDNFCRLKVFEADRTGDAFFLFSGLSFEPSFLDFGEQPFSHPKHVEVTITNIDADQSIDLVTTFGVSQFIFWSRFNQTALSPASSANFNITFLPYTVGDFETSIYIQTSLGVAKYQVFGSSYISDDYLIPLVNLESLDENKKSFELKLVNPLSCSVKVDNLRVFSDGLLTEYCSYSQVTSNSTSRNDLIDNYAFEPIILHSYEKRSLLKATIDADDMELIQISSLLWEFDPYCKPDQIFSGNSTDGMGFLSSTNKFSKLPAASISINKFINQVLYSRVSLLYLGVINSRSGSISKPIEVLFLGNQLLEITSIEANIYDEALSIDITEKIISPHTTTPKTIAIVTLSSAHLSHSYYLSGIITVFTNDQSIYLRIPFYGRLVYGSLTSSVQTVPNYLNEKNQQDPVFLFRFMLTNRYDFTLFISKIDFLTPSHKYLLQIHHHITNAELIPNQTKLFMSISIVDNRITRLHGIMVVYSSISTFHIPYDIYSGKLHFFIDGARQLQDVYLLGTTLIGQIRNQSITIVNLNPVPVELTSVNIYTESDNNAKCEIMKHKHEGCQLSGPCEKCLFQFTEIQSLSEVNIPFSWGNENVAQHIKGFIQIKTKYTVIEQQFEYFVTRGLINVIPNPLIVNSLFPGKIIMHKITVQNAYPTEINITDIKLHRAIMSSDNFDNEISFDIQFYKIKRNKTSNDTNSPYLFQPIQFSANQSRVIGVVYFDPSASCVDRFEDIAQCDTMSTTATVTTTTTSTTNTTNSTAVYPVPYIVKPLGANKPFCYCGFNLDTSLGMLWLKGVRGTVNQSTEKITHQSFINRLIIEETFKLYNELYNQWLKHLMNKDITSKHPFMNKNILTSISYKLPDENVTFFSDLSVRYMWPQITRARKVPINVSSKHLTFCTIKNVPSSLSVSSESENRSLLTHRLMQIPTVTSSSLLSLSEATNSFECIFQITNPQSTINPLFVQPLLWNEVYKIYATNESELNHLKKLITNISADSTFIDSLFTTQYGEFSIQPFLCSDCQLINHSINLTYPPSYILPSNGSGQYFRLIFTPYQNIFELLNQNKVNNEDNIRSLLIIRNNLTSIEPLWLEIHFGRIGLTLGKLSTTKTISKLTKSISAFVSKFENDPSHIKHSISPNIDLYIRNVPPSSSSSGSSSSSSSSSINGFSTLKDNLISSLKIDQTLYDIDLDFTSLFNNKAIHQKIHQDLSLKFEFTEKTIGTFCEPPKTKSIDNLPSPFQSKHRKQSSDSNHFADIDNHQGLLTTLSLRRRLVLLNTGQVTLSIFMLSLLPSMNGRQKFTENFSLTNNLSIPTSYSWLYSHLSCNLNGFKLDPCILPPTTMTTAKMMSINDPDKNNSSNIITILPGQQIIIELRHYPDFTHTFLTANLIIQLYPTLFQSNILQWWDLQQSNKTDDSHILLIDLPKISLQAIFNANLLGSCLSLLPRPSIESFLSMTVFLFYLLNITAILIISYGDAKEIYTRHIKLRHYIDELPENVLSDSSRRFNLNQPSDKLCINCCINDKNLCNPSNRELFTTSNSQLSYSTITTSNTAILMKKQLTNSIIENDEISTLNSTTTGTKLKWKDKINSDEQKLKYEILTTRLDWINYYFQWLLGLLFLIKYISLHWILIIIKYPYKTMKRYIICLGKCKDWLISSLNLINYGYFHCIRQSSSDVINATNDNSQSTPSSNDTMIINKKNLFGLSKQSSADEVKNQKASLKSYSRNLSKLTNQTSDKGSTSRVNRKKKTMVPLVEISKPSGFNANASDDHANVSNRSRFTKIESVSPLPPAATPTTPTQAVNKDASPPRMAEADIVAAVQASIRLTEDVNSNHHHHEIRRKQAQRISSRKKCYNSSSPSSASGPDVDDDNNKSKLDRVMNVFYQNDNSPAHLNCKSDSIDKISSSSSADNQRVVNHQNKKETSKSTVPRLPHTKQLIDEYNEFIAEECVTSQELLETANHKSISSSLIPSSELDKSIKYPHQSLDTVSNSELFDWPETIQTCPNQIARMHHYVTNDQYPLTIYPLWSGAVTELATYWDQTLLHSDEMLYSSDSPDEAMNRLSEETHTFAQSFMTEPTDPSSFHSQFISSQFETTHFIQPTGIYENGLKDYFSQDKFILNNNIYSGIWNTMKENDNNQSYLSTENSPEYLSSDHLVGQGFLQSDHFCDYHINKITVENAFNTTLPIIYSLIQCNDDRKNSSTALQSSSINFPTNTDELDRIDTPLITQIFLDALRTAHRQIVDEINPSYHYTNSIVNSSSENTTPDYYTNDDDNNTMRIDCNPHDSCRTSFCELSRITESRRLSVLNYEAEMNSSIEGKMEIKEEYFDLVPNPLKNGVSNDQISSEELCGYSSWKCIVDIPQSELFQELGLSETTSEQSNFVSTGFMNYENIFNESSAIAPWTYIFEKVIRRINGVDNNQDSSLNCENKLNKPSSSLSFSTTITLTDMIE